MNECQFLYVASSLDVDIDGAVVSAIRQSNDNFQKWPLTRIQRLHSLLGMNSRRLEHN